MEPFEVFPLKVTESLALLTIIGIPDQESTTTTLYDYLHRNGITTVFLTEGSDCHGVRNIAMAFGEDLLKGIESELEALRIVLQAKAVIVEKPVALVRILGPHFDIRPGVAGRLFGKLAKAGIKVLAASTTITTSLLVVPEDKAEQVIRALESIFKVPRSRQGHEA